MKQVRMDERQRQLDVAVKYCEEKQCKGFAALSAGVCPDIKDPRTINRRLNGSVTSGKEKDYCKVLTNTEEELLVQYMKNKDRGLQPTKRKELNAVIVQMLKLRDATNKTMRGERKYIPLSRAAKMVLSNGYAGQAFWCRFDQDHADLSKRHPSLVSLKRMLACSKEMAIALLDNLAEELITAGIFTHSKKLVGDAMSANIAMPCKFELLCILTLTILKRCVNNQNSSFYTN